MPIGTEPTAFLDARKATERLMANSGSNRGSQFWIDLRTLITATSNAETIDPFPYVGEHGSRHRYPGTLNHKPLRFEPRDRTHS